MTRGLYPPDTLSNNDIETLQTLRRDIYSNALKGGLFGMGSGLVLHTAGQWARKLGITKASFNRNTMGLFIMGGGAFGMFLFASSTGKEQVYKLHPIFQVGAMPPKGDEDNLDYAKKVQQAQLLSGSEEGEEHLDMKKLHSVRAVRRKTLQDSLEHGKGFSDAHGGHWYDGHEKNMDAIQKEQLLQDQKNKSGRWF